MGIAISQIIPTTPIQIEDLRGKTLAIDGYNVLYQFLTTIRGPDGTPLTDSKGNVTSHLIGLFTRTTNLLSKGVKLIFVFDGKVPELKRQELERRSSLKAEASVKYEDAKSREDLGEMKKYAGRTAKLSKEMVEQAKELLDALGVPWMQAPSEGEAQAASLVKQGHAWAVVSQDADALLYEAPRIIKNLGITGKRKLPGKLAYITVEPELIEHKIVLQELKIDNEQLRVLAVLIGTDYNIGGVRGIGPKKGLKIVQEQGHDFEKVFVQWDSPVSWKDILQIFEDMPVEQVKSFKFGNADQKKVEKLLVEKHDFSRERVQQTMERLVKEQQNKQKGLGEFF